MIQNKFSKQLKADARKIERGILFPRSKSPAKKDPDRAQADSALTDKEV